MTSTLTTRPITDAEYVLNQRISERNKRAADLLLFRSAVRQIEDPARRRHTLYLLRTSVKPLPRITPRNLRSEARLLEDYAATPLTEWEAAVCGRDDAAGERRVAAAADARTLRIAALLLERKRRG